MPPADGGGKSALRRGRSRRDPWKSGKQQKEGKLRREELRNALPDPEKRCLGPPRLEIYRYILTGWFMSGSGFKKSLKDLHTIFFEDPPKKFLSLIARRIFDTLGLRTNNIGVQSLAGPD
jgi:hypothetical protein